MFGMLTLNKFLILCIGPTFLVFIGGLINQILFNKVDRKIFKENIKLFMQEKKVLYRITRITSLILTVISILYIISFVNEYNKLGYVKSGTPIEGYASMALVGSILIRAVNLILGIKMYVYFLSKERFQVNALLRRKALWLPFILIIGLAVSIISLYICLNTRVHI